VQLQLLTATVKLFLKKGSGAQDLVQRLLKTATSECDNPDIRDRAYVYWRLLSASGQVAKSVVLSEKPPINANQQVLSQRLLDELVDDLGSLASVYHKPKDSFVGKGRFGADAVQRRAIEYYLRSFVTNIREQIQNAQENPIQAQSKSNIENLLDLDMGGATEETTSSPTAPNKTVSNILDDLGGLSLDKSSAPPVQEASPPNQFIGSPAPATAAPTNNMNDLLGIFGGSGQSNAAFGGENVWGDISAQNGPPAAKSKSTNEDILGLF
jgi:AP-1 complex subunit beta-1